MGKSTISMVIFNSYVKLPEGIPSFKLWMTNNHWPAFFWTVHKTNHHLGPILDSLKRGSKEITHVLWKKNLCPIVPPTSANLLDPPGAAASKKKNLIRVRHLASRWPNALHLLGCRPVRPRPRHPCTHQVLKRFVHLTWAIAAHCIEAFLPLPSCPKFVRGLHALP